MNRNSSHGRAAEVQAEMHSVEARLAARLAAVLTASAQKVPHDIGERLRVAREQALHRARLAREAAPGRAQLVGVSAAGAAALVGFAAWRHRLALGLPLVLMIAGLVAIERYTVREHVMAAADIDAQLLSDALPPSAYSDPGFAEYLRTVPPQ